MPDPRLAILGRHNDWICSNRLFATHSTNHSAHDGRKTDLVTGSGRGQWRKALGCEPGPGRTACDGMRARPWSNGMRRLPATRSRMAESGPSPNGERISQGSVAYDSSLCTQNREPGRSMCQADRSSSQAHLGVPSAARRRKCWRVGVGTLPSLARMTAMRCRQRYAGICAGSASTRKGCRPAGWTFAIREEWPSSRRGTWNGTTASSTC